MSRSYKKTPRSGEKKDKFFKKYANHRLRQRPIDDPDLKHGTYKKYSCSWNICDYETVGVSFEEYWRSVVRRWNQWKSYHPIPFPSKDEAYREWYRWFKRK